MVLVKDTLSDLLAETSSHRTFFLIGKHDKCLWYGIFSSKLEHGYR
jgi:hypothetical protein